MRISVSGGSTSSGAASVASGVIKFMAGKPTGLPVGETAFNLPFFVQLNNFYASLLF